jgi:hypothetical protein
VRRRQRHDLPRALRRQAAKLPATLSAAKGYPAWCALRRLNVRRRLPGTREEGCVVAVRFDRSETARAEVEGEESALPLDCAS